MGRLTLNILLSFAQFEREVTGERIRDKIAASKKKGMWMGGLVPLGYDLDGRKLVPNPKEAELVCKIFALYLNWVASRKLADRLESREDQKQESGVRKLALGLEGFPSPVAPSTIFCAIVFTSARSGTANAGIPESTKASCRKSCGTRSRPQLNSNLGSAVTASENSRRVLLTGLMEDGNGNRFTPSFTIKRGRRYRYYVSQLAIKNSARPKTRPTRVPAHEVESRVMERLQGFLTI